MKEALEGIGHANGFTIVESFVTAPRIDIIAVFCAFQTTANCVK